MEGLTQAKVWILAPCLENFLDGNGKIKRRNRPKIINSRHSDLAGAITILPRCRTSGETMFPR